MRAWCRSESLQPITMLVLITDCTSPNFTDRPQVNIHCIDNFFTVHDFLSNLRLPWKKQSCPEKFHSSEYTFYIQNFQKLALALKNRCFPWNFSLYWIYFLQISICGELRLLCQQGCPEIIQCIEYTFHIHEFWTTCACTEKQRVPRIHSTEYKFFIIQDLWATCACTE